MASLVAELLSHDSLDVEFPIRKSGVYLNHAGIAPLPHRAYQELKRFAEESMKGGVASYPEWLRRLRHAREEAAKLLNAKPADIAFVKGTTYGLQLIAAGIDWKPGDTIVVEEHTFPANWYPWAGTRRLGTELWQWPERKFQFDLTELEARLRQGGVRIVSVTSAMFSTGWRHDLTAIGKLCKEHGALFCVDAIQTLGAFPLDVEECGADFVCAGGQKWLLGVEGIGIFYCAPHALQHLGDHVVGWYGRENPHNYGATDGLPAPDARRFEEGNNMAGAMALGASIATINAVGIDTVAQMIRANARRLHNGLESLGWEVFSPREESNACGIVSCAHPKHSSLHIAELLGHMDVHVVARRDWVRFSPHFYNTTDEMQRALDAVRDVMG